MVKATISAVAMAALQVLTAERALKLDRHFADMPVVSSDANSNQLKLGFKKAVVIDLSDVSFLASAGMSLLASTHQKLGGAAGFAVVADGPSTGRPLTLVGLHEVFGIYATVDEALAALTDG